MSLHLFFDGAEVPLKQWLFPAKEVGIKFEVDSAPACRSRIVVIKVQWEGNDDMFALAQLVDAVRQNTTIHSLTLDIPYFPYSRQDRRCFQGEGHALKVVAEFINSLKFDKVITKDAHSYVLEALVDNLSIIPQHQCASGLPLFSALIAPDQGASKKIFDNNLVKKFGVPVVVASKVRDSCGKITQTSVDVGGVCSDNVCVVDDLCDGGATFIELAKALNTCSVGKKSLYVTHGIFSKGVDELLRYYENIYVSNLMNQSVKQFVKEI